MNSRDQKALPAQKSGTSPREESSKPTKTQCGQALSPNLGCGELQTHQNSVWTRTEPKPWLWRALFQGSGPQRGSRPPLPPPRTIGEGSMFVFPTGNLCHRHLWVGCGPGWYQGDNCSAQTFCRAPRGMGSRGMCLSDTQPPRCCSSRCHGDRTCLTILAGKCSHRFLPTPPLVFPLK